jgi:hypothetical protein
MTTTGLAFSFTDEHAPSLPKHGFASEKLGIAVLTMAFLLSYLQFCFERSDLIRLVPVGLLWTGTFAFLLVCPRDTRRTALLTVFHPATWAIIAAVSVPPLLSSLYRHSAFSFQYGLVMIAMLIVARILLSGIGFEGLLVAFFYATTAGILIVAGLTFSDLLASIGATRYAPLQFDPNRIAFFAVTAIPAQLWFAFRRRRYYVLLVTAFTVFVTIAASSRGSIGGLLIGAVVTALLSALRFFRFSSFAFSRNTLIGALVLLCVIVGVAAAHEPAVGNAGQFLWTKLALESRQRGLSSGFTGRTQGWSELLDIWPKTSWVAGNGFRTSDEDFSFSVDNGYLASLYELGLFSFLVVLAKYLFAFYIMAVAYVSDKSSGGTCLPALLFTCTVFFANAFVHRVFLGYGDQASLLLLFVFMSSRHDVLEAVHPAATAFSSVAQ